MIRIFQVRLVAFVEVNNIACSIPVWSGNSLSQLSKEQFNHFKKFYGINNLSLDNQYCYITPFPDFSDDDYYYFNDDFKNFIV